MAVVKHKRGTRTSLISTGLNSLANNGRAIGSAYNNVQGGGGGDGYILGQLEFVLSFAVAPTANTMMSVWFIQSPGGTNYEYGDSGSVTPTRPPDVQFPLANTTSQTVVMSAVSLPPGLWKPLVLNDSTGQALSASGSELWVTPYTPETI